MPIPWLAIQAAIMAGGAISGGRRKDRQTKNLLEMLAQYSDPRMINRDAQQYYNQWQNSPAYTGGLSAINVGANRAAMDVAGSNAMRGLTGTGIGSIISGLGSNTAGFKIADMNAGAWKDSMAMAKEIAMNRFNNAGYLKGPRDVGGDMLGGIMDWLGKIDTSKLPQPKPKTAPTPTSSRYRGPTGWGRPQGNLDFNALSNFAQLMSR